MTIINRDRQFSMLRLENRVHIVLNQHTLFFAYIARQRATMNKRKAL